MSREREKQQIYQHEQVRVERNLPVRFVVYEESDTFVPRHWHGSMEIIYILGGLMQVEDNDRSTLLQKDDYIIINSRDIHSTRCIGSTQVLLLQIPLSFLKVSIPDYDSIRFEGYEEPFKNPEQNEIRQLLVRLAELFTHQKEEGYPLAFMGMLYTLLYTLVKQYKRIVTPQARLKTAKNLERLDLIADFVEENYQNPLTILDGASIIHVSEEYFCRYFKRYMGMTFLEYVNTIRLHHVYEDLIGTDLPISEILETHGFTNYRVFMRMFKESYGMTPMQKRRSMTR